MAVQMHFVLTVSVVNFVGEVHGYTCKRLHMFPIIYTKKLILYWVLLMVPT